MAALEGHSEKGRYDSGTTDDIAKPGYGVADEFDATFAYHFFNFPAEFGLSWVLPRIVGLTHANDI